MAGQKLTNKKELFKFYNSSLQNVVEKIFGITKCRFPIFEIPVVFTINIEVKIVLVVTGLHNFI